MMSDQSKPQSDSCGIKALLDERKHLEDLLQQRFNFFLVTFGFAITAGVEIDSDEKRGVFILGLTFILIFVWMPLWRAGILHRTTMALIKKQECQIKHIRDASGIDDCGMPTATSLMVSWVPLLCGLFLFVWGIVSLGCPCSK